LEQAKLHLKTYGDHNGHDFLEIDEWDLEDEGELDKRFKKETE
jgi:hypothetical protein